MIDKQYLRHQYSNDDYLDTLKNKEVISDPRRMVEF